MPLPTINNNRVSSERIFRASACAAGGKKRERTLPPPPCASLACLPPSERALRRRWWTAETLNDRWPWRARARFLFRFSRRVPPPSLTRLRARPSVCLPARSPRPAYHGTRAYKCSLFGRSRFLEMRLAMPVTGSYTMIGGAGRAIGFLRNGRWG